MPMFRRREREAPQPTCEGCGGVYYCKCDHRGVTSTLERKVRVADEAREFADIRWGGAFAERMIYLSHGADREPDWFVVKAPDGRGGSAEILSPWDERALREVARLLVAYRRVLLLNTTSFFIHVIQRVDAGCPWAIHKDYPGGLPLGPNAPRHPAMGD